MGTPRLEVPVGERFGHLVVLEPAPVIETDKGRRMWAWKCRCDCGDVRTFKASRVKKGLSRSCGCESRKVLGRSTTKHGFAQQEKSRRHPLYATWCSMRQRCRDENHPGYRLYGGRGIEVCSRWDDFAAFVEDMGERPDGMSLDRIDNDGNYEPDNVRWATAKEQQANRRDSS
jgi:hypothetical protein